MKSKLVGYLVSAVFVGLVVWVLFRIPATRNLILGTQSAAAS